MLRLLPYSFRKAWDTARVRSALRQLESTNPVEVSSPDVASTEIFILFCRRDLQLGILAAKSLLRFFDTPPAMTLTDDGSLSISDRVYIDRHLPGCRWLPRIADDSRMKAALSARSQLQSVYQSDYHPICKLLHPALLARCERVIVMDPDTAFYRRPDALMYWAAGNDSKAMFLHDQQNEETNVPTATREAFDELRNIFMQSGRHWSMPYHFFNSGLLAFRPEQCELDIAEEYLLWRQSAPPRYKSGTPALWFGDWTPEQTSYQLIFATMSPPASPFGQEYRLGHVPDCTFNHFLWLNVAKSQTLQTLRTLTSQLS